jgi:hypothetical protein
VVEGAPLLRAYGSKAHRGFESLPLRHGRALRGRVTFLFSIIAPVAQLDRAPGYEPGVREFESLRAHHGNEKCRLRAGFFRSYAHRRVLALGREAVEFDNFAVQRSWTPER